MNASNLEVKGQHVNKVRGCRDRDTSRTAPSDWSSLVENDLTKKNITPWEAHVVAHLQSHI